MTRTGPKLPARPDGGLDQPWHAADPIPVPDVVQSDGDSAWQLFDDLARQQEARFAPTAPMNVPPAAPDAGERAWAPTQPAGRAPLHAARPRPQPLFTLDAAMLVARRNNRVCPRPMRWTEFFAMLPPRKTARGQQLPPAPVTGPAWDVTPALTKRLCFREHIEWAEGAGLLEAAIAFMQAMREDEWLHMSEG